MSKSLRDQLSEDLQKSRKDIEKKQKDAAEYKMFRSISIKIGKSFGINLYNELKKEYYKEEVHHRLGGTAFSDFEVLTGNYEIKDVMPDHIRDNKIYNKFFDILDSDGRGVLIFKVTGMKEMVMYTVNEENLIPGCPRIVVYGKGDQKIYVIGLNNFLKENNV